MNGVQSSFWDAFGMHDPYKGQQVSHHSIQQENRSRLVGYIPVVGGQFKAWGRWKQVYDYNNRQYEDFENPMRIGYRIGLVVRGIFEFLGLGLVLLFTLDLGTTLARAFNVCKSKTEEPFLDTN